MIVVLSNAVGNLFLSFGMKEDTRQLSLSPLDYIATILHPWVMAGIALLVLWMLSRMAFLSWADLSYVLPVTAAGYVVSLVLAKTFLGESVSVGRWAGTALIVAGIALVAPSKPNSGDAVR